VFFKKTLKEEEDFFHGNGILRIEPGKITIKKVLQEVRKPDSVSP
jgi:hypothetical protein